MKGKSLFSACPHSLCTYATCDQGLQDVFSRSSWISLDQWKMFALHVIDITKYSQGSEYTLLLVTLGLQNTEV